MQVKEREGGRPSRSWIRMTQSTSTLLRRGFIMRLTRERTCGEVCFPSLFNPPSFDLKSFANWICTDMVAAEERKIAARKEAVHSDLKSNSNSKSSSQTHPNEKEAKNKIASEHKSAGKVDHKEAEEKEKKNQESQDEKEGAARKHAGADVQVRGRQ